MDGFSLEVIERLPLADAVLSAMSWVAEPELLESIYGSHRGRSYAKELSFPDMVALVQDALLEHQGSGRRAMIAAEKREELKASRQAAYAKLRRLSISLSVGFLAKCSDRVREIFPAKAMVSLPASLRAFEAYAVDGKKIKNASKRLKPSRGYTGTPLGGKTLAALDLRRGLITAFSAHPDGETNDAPLVPDLLPQVRARSPKRRRLWLADRQFCDLVQTRNFSEGNDAFLLRYHSKNSFLRDLEILLKEGTDAQGRRYCEEWGYLGKDPKRRFYVRRITLFRKGEESIILVTNLLDAEQYPATDLLQMYLMRWGIERVFQQVTEVFHLERLISSTPEGTIFQFAFCALLYNLIQVVRGYIAEAQSMQPECISVEMLFHEVHRELLSLSQLAERETVLGYFAPSSDAHQVKSRLTSLLADVWEDEWIKSPKKKNAPTRKKKTVKGGHTSIYRLIRAAPSKRK